MTIKAKDINDGVNDINKDFDSSGKTAVEIEAKKVYDKQTSQFMRDRKQNLKHNAKPLPKSDRMDAYHYKLGENVKATFKNFLIEKFKPVATHLPSGKPNPNHPAYTTHKAKYDADAKANRAPRAPRAKQAGPDLDKIFFDLTQIISQFFPDGDPADYFPAYYRKTGINVETARKAFKKNGYKDEYAYIDDMKGGDYGYNESVVNERADREDDEHGGGPTPAQNPDKGWKPNRVKKTVIEDDEVNEARNFKVTHRGMDGKIRVIDVSAKSHAEAENLFKTKHAGQFRNIKSISEAELDENAFDWKKAPSAIDWTGKGPTKSAEGGTVYKARTAARNAENGGVAEKNKVGRPVGSHPTHKIDREERAKPENKQALSKKVIDAKKIGFEWKRMGHDALMKRQLELAGLDPSDHQAIIDKKNPVRANKILAK